MSDMLPGTAETTCTVLDPTLARWRRRYFYQPDTGPARRAFTARRAATGRMVTSTLRQRWSDARERETVRRADKAWI